MPFSEVEATISRRPQAYPTNPVTIGEHLLKRRIDLQLTKSAVARQIGIGRPAITLWENGKCTPDVIQMKGIIAFLGYYPLPEPTTLAGQIRKYRNVHGLTLGEFGKLLSVAEATVWTWENERYAPVEATIQKIKDLINQNEVS